MPNPIVHLSRDTQTAINLTARGDADTDAEERLAGLLARPIDA